MIMAAFAGTGKTTLASLYPQTVIDFFCMPYKYYLDDNDGKNHESNKAKPDYVLQDDWPDNYVDAIKQNLNLNKILLIPSDWRVLSMLRNVKIQYTLCYPKRSAKEVYEKRFIDRGNSEYFLDIFIGRWDSFFDALEKDKYGRHIILEPDQYLSDVIDVKAFLSEAG